MKSELDRILKCEKEYTECTSVCYDKGKYYQYIDDNMKDMYDHNFIEVKDMNDTELQDFVPKETKSRKENNIGFFKIKTGNLPKDVPVDFEGNKPEIEHVAAYAFKGESVSQWKSLDNCKIRKVTDESMVSDLADMDVTMYGSMCGEGFCRRREVRMGREYLSDSNLDMYIGYLDGQPVGSCELYINNNVAKIESFTVLDEFQRRGIGTTILKCLMEKACEQKADIRYLIADEDDTPKEMYEKLGFTKICDIYSLFWKL